MARISRSGESMLHPWDIAEHFSWSKKKGMGASRPSKEDHPHFRALQSSKIIVPKKVELGTIFSVGWEKPESTLGGKHCDYIGFYSADPKEKKDPSDWHGILPFQKSQIKVAKGRRSSKLCIVVAAMLLFLLAWIGEATQQLITGNPWRNGNLRLLSPKSSPNHLFVLSKGLDLHTLGNPIREYRIWSWS